MLPYPKRPEPSFREMRATFSKRNPGAIEIECRDNRMAIQGLAIGLLVGIVFRVAWDLGIILPAMLVIKDAAIAIWIILCDLATACGHVLK
jgi:hypothetical protein